jgi:hypothetical protein
MASQRESVMLEARLNGMGREFGCTISALRVSLPDTNAYSYARLMIFEAYEAAIPDGRYDLTFEGRTIPVERRNGTWLAPVS